MACQGNDHKDAVVYHNICRLAWFFFSGLKSIVTFTSVAIRAVLCEIVWFLAFGLFVSLYDSQIDVKDCVWFSVFMFPEFVVPKRSYYY